MAFRDFVAEHWPARVSLNLPQLSALLAQQGGDRRDRDLIRARQKLARAQERRVNALMRAGGGK